MNGISPIQEIIEEIRAGNMVILVDEEDRENEGDIVFAAEFATPEKINFMARHARGLICLTLTEAHCRKLNLPLMVQENGLQLATNFTISIEAANGVTTGISAGDRARTVLAAVDKNATPADIVQPGHIFPLRAQNGGVLVRAGHTEAGCDLAQMAGLTPASVICEILKDDGEMARLPDLIDYARLHNLKIGTIADLIEHRSQNEKLVERVAMRPVQTAYGEFNLATYVDKTTQRTHLALVKGEINPQEETLVRVHEPLSVIDFLEQKPAGQSTSVHEAMQRMARAPAAVLVLLHRGETPQNLLARATNDATTQPQWDSRSYGIGAQILRDLNVGKMRLLATPHKMPSMTGFGLEVVGYADHE
ncbi:MAG TPA: 3,4-dihydroxy-2-butanone-4-phosphate synthase [Gallionella sp.]|jgi:3,4-dihydroxy 2-butanone 4-phosphate synthase/GTP cyclohydrolase II|nr:bifunctional 3,4-dihydroxy-2-butanone-4-phosphate synthase/GTP cyclohydrolase II [Gallionella sp.]OGS67008.1 MAG: 3,4-dihydroxy-2-butanone-4-phosphate synthase [Gallionellales bacterium GWA2_54_124]OGT17214.1 MAG: 3,4-dihydroxy-2-butanone-4-phosphate synthase [Gallionellales bacterium RIFOXYD12_FULL_53_10]HCI51780.1 3,4-dihydroxy-2-butanone-4-phosphate synthase [Gallionella sp.]